MSDDLDLALRLLDSAMPKHPCRGPFDPCCSDIEGWGDVCLVEAACDLLADHGLRPRLADADRVPKEQRSSTESPSS